MTLLSILRDERFHPAFSFLLGLGIICIIRPMCKGDDCNIKKAPTEKDFDQYVYRIGGDECYEFKTKPVSCPPSGAIEAFGSPALDTAPTVFFSKRTTPIFSRD